MSNPLTQMFESSTDSATPPPSTHPDRERQSGTVITRGCAEATLRSANQAAEGNRGDNAMSELLELTRDEIAAAAEQHPRLLRQAMRDAHASVDEHLSPHPPSHQEDPHPHACAAVVQAWRLQLQNRTAKPPTLPEKLVLQARPDERRVTSQRIIIHEAPRQIRHSPNLRDEKWQSKA